ncbi:ATP-grasp domain-containing protein [Kordia sp.]|uniref:ATP-grasp domain-containing protein n=1 Tax=Kordia sp. TaxID=1965332 RepID=UPI003B5C04C7
MTTIPNNKRNLVRIMYDIAKDHTIDITSFSFDWILKLSKNGIHKHIFGYNFEINSSTAKMIAGDKSAASDLLKAANITTVEHTLFLNPSMEKYVGSFGNWEQILAYFHDNNQHIVCKPVDGTGGNGVLMVATVTELEQAIHTLFSKHRSICLSPFYDIKKEYRAVILDGNVQLLYQKNIPFIEADGSKTILELLQSTFSGEALDSVIGSFSKKKDLSFSDIPPKGKIIEANWKSNLGEGAQAEILENEAIENLAIKAANAINIRFCSVDIIETTSGEFYVMEINSGVMIEHFLNSNPQEYDRIKAIYEKAVLRMLEV